MAKICVKRGRKLPGNMWNQEKCYFIPRIKLKMVLFFFLVLQSNLVDFMLIMPEKSTKINAIAKSLNANTLTTLISSLQGEELEVFIPQLATVSRNLNLTPLVRSRGINLIFNANRAEMNTAFDQSRHAYLEQISQNAYFTTSFTALNAISGISANTGE